MATYSNSILFANSTSLDVGIRLVKSKSKAKAIEDSNQIPDGGILVVYNFNENRYTKITDGAKKLSEIPKIDQSSGPTTVTWNDVTNKPAVIGAGATAAEARTAIGAGTSNLAIGTTATTAKAGNYQPTSANISDASTVGKAVLVATDAAAARTAIGAGTSNLAIGITATTAKAGNYQPTAANISDATATGRSVLTATDADTALEALGGTDIGINIFQAPIADIARTELGLGTAALSDDTDFATAAQGVLAEDALPKAGGTLTGSLAGTTIILSGDIEVASATNGPVLRSPGGTRYRISVTDVGVIQATAVTP